MRRRRLKILNKHGGVRPELAGPYDDGEEGVIEWVTSQIPPPPLGQLCEDGECGARQREREEEVDDGLDEGEERTYSPKPAETYLWRVKDDHVCFTYVCDMCDEAAEGELEPIEPGEYPTTEGGYAVAPTHCR